MTQLTQDIREICNAQGYAHPRVINGKVCAIGTYLYTYGLVVGIDERGHESRYCYERLYDAIKGLLLWDGKGDPKGPWVKHKGLNVDRLNPDIGVM